MHHFQSEYKPWNVHLQLLTMQTNQRNEFFFFKRNRGDTAEIYVFCPCKSCNVRDVHIYNLLKNLQHKNNLLTFSAVENERGVCKLKLKVHFVGCAIWSNLYQLSDRMVDWVPGGCPPLIWRSSEIIFLRIIKQPDMAGLFLFFFYNKEGKEFCLQK